MKSSTFLAIDLGAESGRFILGTLDDRQIELNEVHRFPNRGVELCGHLYWDVLYMWNEIKEGISKAAVQSDGAIRSIGLDTWGVDFGLLDAQDRLIGNPYHYRDSRTNGMMENVFQQVSREEIYAQTGIQFMQLNSLFQLFAMVETDDPALNTAYTFLNMPDLFNFFLTGRKTSELTIASTTQCYNPKTKNWAKDMLETLSIPTSIFPDIVEPGCLLGNLQAPLISDLGLPETVVIAGAGHDTASAVAAVPASTEDYIFLSSGTWSLMGVELDEPLISTESMTADMTNEGGVNEKIRYLKNIPGMWLVQECRRCWSSGIKDYSYAELTEKASAAPAFGPLINPDDTRFLAPDHMPTAIQSFCRDTGQDIPEGQGAILRCVLESLAMEYRLVAESIDRLTGKPHPNIHIIGGGTRNGLLNQLAANATGRTVIAGPVEATAIGNILVQAIAMGEISSLAEGREIVRDSFDVKTYEPRKTADWDDSYKRYKGLKNY